MGETGGKSFCFSAEIQKFNGDLKLVIFGESGRSLAEFNLLRFTWLSSLINILL